MDITAAVIILAILVFIGSIFAIRKDYESGEVKYVIIDILAMIISLLVILGNLTPIAY